jgi:hypothetical protein
MSEKRSSRNIVKPAHTHNKRQGAVETSIKRVSLAHLPRTGIVAKQASPAVELHDSEKG